MPTYTYTEDIEDVLGGGDEFTAEDVESCTDEQQLRDWWSSLEVAGDNIRAQLDAARAAGRDNDAWVYRASRALAFVSIGCGRIKRRMKALGIQINSQDSMIEELKRKLQTMKADAAFGRAFIHFAKRQLPSHEFNRLQSEAMAQLESKQPLPAE